MDKQINFKVNIKRQTEICTLPKTLRENNELCSFSIKSGWGEAKDSIYPRQGRFYSTERSFHIENTEIRNASLSGEGLLKNSNFSSTGSNMYFDQEKRELFPSIFVESRRKINFIRRWYHVAIRTSRRCKVNVFDLQFEELYKNFESVCVYIE